MHDRKISPYSIKYLNQKPTTKEKCMKLDITLRHLGKSQYKSVKKQLKQLVEQHLQPYLNHFNENSIRLHATLNKQKNNYKVQYQLHLPPRKILIAKEISENLNNALEGALKELARQAQKHAAKISGRESWKRKQRRQRLKKFKTDVQALPEITQKQAEESFEPLLKKLESYIRHELAYLQANEDLPSSYPTVEDVRDETLLKVQFKWDELEKDSHTLYQELIKAVHEVLTEELIHTQIHMDDISFDASIPKDAKDQSDDMVGDEISEFYQPFERLHIEDIIPDTSADIPEELLEKNARELSYQTMTNLPTNWRRILVLTHRENLPIDTIAQTIMPMALSDAKQLLDYAEKFMLASLNERGLGNINQAILKQLLR